MIANKSGRFPSILTPHNSGRSVLNSGSEQPKESNTRRHQHRRHCNNLPEGPFIRENDIQVDLLRIKIKLEIKEEPEPTDTNTMREDTLHQGIQANVNGPHNNLRRNNSDSDISVGSTELRIVEDNEDNVVNVESLSDEDEKVDISDEDLERMFAQKDKEISHLRKQVSDLRKTIKEQDEKITNLNKLVQKHETIFNRIVEVGGDVLLENAKYELKAIKEGERKSETGTSGAGQREEATATGQDQGGSQSSSLGTSGSASNNNDGGGFASKGNSQVKRNRAVTFGQTFYEGESSQPRQFYQHKRQGDWHVDGQRGKRRRDWFLHDNRTSTPPYKRQTQDPYYLSPTSIRRFRAGGQGYRGRGAQAQFNFRHHDVNVRSPFNHNYHHQNQNFESFSATNETSHQMNQNSNSSYNGGGVRINESQKEEVDTQPENEMEDDEVFQCPHCPWKFGERQNMERHCEAQHKFFKCNMCGKQYGFQESLRRHLLSEH